ncbi:MAG: hypothetical protein WBV94_07760 [Blastocatellia bacterium]
MSVKPKSTQAALSNGKKKSSRGKVRVGVPSMMRGGASVKRSESIKGSPVMKHPKNAEEATLLAWEKTYENRNKRFKI